jgi:hypothetical protein
MATDWDGEERRKNRLHADDIGAIVAGVTDSLSDHYCRFADIKTEDMKDVIPFMLSFKSLTEKTGVIVWKAIVVGILMIAGGLFSLGFWSNMK